MDEHDPRWTSTNFDFDFDFDFDQLDAPSATRSRPSGVGIDPKLVAAYHGRRSPYGRALRWVFGLLALAALAQELVGTHYDRKLTAAARAVTGQPDVEVNCRRVWDELTFLKANPGFVMWGSKTANLSFGICMDALSWASDPDDEHARVAIMILTHELGHLAGHFDEAETECVAMWAVPRTAMALGGSEVEGRRTAQWYAASYNPLLRGDYVAPGCLANRPPVSPMLR